FTKIFKGDISQEELYNESVNPLVKSFVNGHNCLLFAYGTSSAGKTYTIQGNPKEPGVLPRALSVVFSSIKGKGSCTCRFKPDMVDRVVELDDKTVQQELAYKQKIMTWSQGNDHSRFNKYSQISDSGFDAHSEVSGVSIQNQDFVSNLFHELQLSNDSIVSLDGQDDFVYSVWVSFAEIYNENIFDLLEPVPTRGQKRPPLALGEDCDGQVYIKGLRHIWVSSGEEAYQVLLFGQHNLKFAPTALNSVSSRSHCIFTIKLLQHVKVQQPKRLVYPWSNTKEMRMKSKKTDKFLVKDKHIDNVEEFLYLGSVIATLDGALEDVKSRIRKANSAFSILLYACETWITSKTIENKLQVFINRYLKNILKLKWPETASNCSPHLLKKILSEKYKS
ncbi:hypothetical protein C0J52_16692, partial [Blattella germanica]